MKFNDLRVAHKMWSVILGLLALMLVAGVWTQWYGRQVNAATEEAVKKYESAITTAVTWRGLAETVVTMSQARFVTTDDGLRADFDARVTALTARITPVQEKINSESVSAQDKAALADVAAAGFHREVEHGAYVFALGQPQGFGALGVFTQLEQQLEHPPPRRPGGQFGHPVVAVFQCALPALHQLTHQRRVQGAQRLHHVAGYAAQGDRRAGDGVVAVGAAQQHLLPQQVTTASQTHDATVATLADAFQAHDARTQGVDGFARVAGLVQRFADGPVHLDDVGLNGVEVGVAQRPKQGGAAHDTTEASPRRRVGGIKPVLQDGMHLHTLGR